MRREPPSFSRRSRMPMVPMPSVISSAPRPSSATDAMTERSELFALIYAPFPEVGDQAAGGGERRAANKEAELRQHGGREGEWL